MLHRLGLPSSYCQLVALIWALNPVTTVIATRGSADALSNLLFLLVLHLLLTGSHLMAGVSFGLLVHLRLVHVVYSPALLLSVLRGDAPRTLKDHPTSSLWQRCYLSYHWREGVLFGAPALGSFLALLLLCYRLYGEDYLASAILYHLSRYSSLLSFSSPPLIPSPRRTDFRHNFSALFLPIYLSFGSEDRVLRYICFFPQMLLLLITSLTLARRDSLYVCVFVQTMAFVAYNKVRHPR